jgi:hypothetical protein
MSKISFDKLVAAARSETPPKVDVADDVISTLFSSKVADVVSYRPLAWIASASTAMAAGIAVAAFMFMRNTPDSAVTDLYQAISWIAQ